MTRIAAQRDPPLVIHCSPKPLQGVFAIDSLSGPRLAYASFDRFPSPKGAATHIDAFTAAIAERFGGLDLFTVAPAPDELDFCRPPAVGVRHQPILCEGAHLFERTRQFRVRLWRRLEDSVRRNGPLDLIHIRSIFEGYPIAKAKDRFCRRLVYEVNGLPSIELKYHYPEVADDEVLLGKLREQERVCLQAADRILTVSEVNSRHLQSLGVSAEKIDVIPNGVDLASFTRRPPRPLTGVAFDVERPIELLYCGGLTSWQGLSHALDALALIRRDAEARLTVVGPSRPRQRKWLDNLAFRLGVFDRLRRLPPVGRDELVRLHHEADIVLAPLSRNDRNNKQGCCPLKVIEAMACGIPLIASDLEVVRELATNEEHALLVRPNSGKAIKDAVFRLVREPGLATRLADAARNRVEAEYGWSRAQQQLLQTYERLLAVEQAASSSASICEPRTG